MNPEHPRHLDKARSSSRLRLILEPWPAAAVTQAFPEAPRDAVRVCGYELAIRQAPFDLPRASYPRAVAGCGAGGNIFDPEDWCDVFATESVYMRSGCLAMSRERSGRLIVRSKSIMDDKKRILVESAVEYVVTSSLYVKLLSSV